MSHTLPTVRVAHHSDASKFITINVEDMADHHVLWSEQAPGFDYGVLCRPIKPLDPALRDAAANLMMRVVDTRLKYEGDKPQGITGMSPAEQLEVINSYALEFDATLERMAAAKAESDSRSTDSAGQTQDTSGVTQEIQGQQTGSSGDQVNQDKSGEPVDEASDKDVYDVESSSRGKFYVRRGGKRVSRAFSTLEEAEAARVRMESAE